MTTTDGHVQIVATLNSTTIKTNYMQIYGYDITLQEVPGEISLVISVSGCALGCDGCSWHYAKDKQSFELSHDAYVKLLNLYAEYITCVCFLGGEWSSDIVKFIDTAKKQYNLDTCLYTGLDNVGDIPFSKHLDYIKIGRWIKTLGGLSEEGTNQRMFNLNTCEDITYKFKRGEL